MSLPTVNITNPSTPPATTTSSSSPLTTHEYYIQPHVLIPLTVIGVSILLAIFCAMIECCFNKGWIKELPYPELGLRRKARDRQRRRGTRVKVELRRLGPRRGRRDERTWIGRDDDVLPSYEVRIPPPVYERIGGQTQGRKYFGGV